MKVFEAIGKGLGLVAKNPKLFLLLIAVSIILILIGIPILIAIFGPAGLQAGATPGATLTPEQLAKINWWLFSLFIIASTLIQIFINAGVIGSVKDVIKTNTFKLGNFLNSAKSLFGRFVVFALVMVLALAIVVLIVVLLGILAGAIGGAVPAIGVILGVIVGILAIIALAIMGIYGSYGPVVMALDDKKALESFGVIAGFLKGKMLKSISLGAVYWTALILITVVNNLVVTAGGAGAVAVQIISGLLNMYLSIAYIASFMYFYAGENAVKKA